MKRLLPWFTVLLILVIGFGTIYASVQQSQRNEANSPQIQFAQDTAASLDKQVRESTLDGKVDIAKSLKPFTIIYDKKGQPLIGTGYLDSKLPKVPVEILTKSKGKDYNAVTWQPRDGLRIAAVTVSAKDHYVLSGRSIKEVEKNMAASTQIVLLGAIIAIGLLGVVFILSGVAEEY